jgi:hypothetical protein
MSLTLEALEKDAASRWRVEPLPDGLVCALVSLTNTLARAKEGSCYAPPACVPDPRRSYLVGNGPGHLVFSIGQSQKLQVIALRKGQSAVASRRSALRHFKGAVDPEGHLRDGIRDLLRISIKRRGKGPFFCAVPMRRGARKRGPLPQERILERLEQILGSETAPSRERLRDKLVADLKAVEVLLWNPKRRNFPGSVAQLAQSLGRVPAMGEITKELGIGQDHCSKLCRQYGYQWLPRLPSKRKNY